MSEQSTEDHAPNAPDVVEAASAPQSRSRRGGGALKAAAALAIIAGAGVVIVQNLPPRPWFPQTVGPAATAGPQAPAPLVVLEADDPADVRMLLTVAKHDAGSNTVELGRAVGPQEWGRMRETAQVLLWRELYRQAFLIAARDERGVSTRDELLDDAPPTPGGPTVEIRAVYRTPGVKRLLVRAVVEDRVDETSAPLLLQDLDPAGRGDPDFADAILAEKLSRSEIPEVLDGLGVKGRPNAWRPDAAVPEGVEAQLSTLGIVDHVLALRSLHAAIRADGESPARLGPLVRGYAQLAALTAHHWGASNRAFQARSLLYAQRLIEKDPGAASSIRHRAFANALAGYHAMALKDLESAAKADAAGAGAPPPAWADVLDAYMKYDVKRLEAVRPPFDRLAALLKMDALEFPMHSRPLVHAAEEVIRLDPDCARAYDVISFNGALGDAHKSTVLGPRSFQLFLRKKLDEAAELPKGVRDALEDEVDDPALDLALMEAGRVGVDPVEPSWGVLAHLALEDRFAQVDRRLNFMAKRWNVPVDDYWRAARPLIERHRFRPYLGAISGRPEEARKYPEFLATYDRSDLQLRALEFVIPRAQGAGPGPDSGRSDWQIVLSHCHSAARDVGMLVAHMPEGSRSKYAGKLLEVSPYSPFARATLIEYDWQNSQPRLETWLQESGESPAILRALATRFIELERFEDARRLLVKYVVQSPDRWGFEQLAECRLREGDEDGWLETLDSYLENTEAAGLEHAELQVKLADHFILKGDPARAKPYADEAAETWAAWAMLCAARVDELLGDYDSAETRLRQVTERYPNMWAPWYLFCRRTGTGDVESAIVPTRAAIGGSESVEPEYAAFFHWIEGDTDEAIRTLEASMEAEPTGPVAIPLALLYDQVGANDRRDELMGRIVEGAVEKIGPKTNALCRLLQTGMAHPDQTPDSAAFDAALEAYQPDFSGHQQMFVGRFFLNRGRPDDAKKYLEGCLKDPTAASWYRTPAAVWLRQAFPNEKKPADPVPKEAEPKPTGDRA